MKAKKIGKQTHPTPFYPALTTHNFQVPTLRNSLFPPTHILPPRQSRSRKSNSAKQNHDVPGITNAPPRLCSPANDKHGISLTIVSRKQPNKRKPRGQQERARGGGRKKNKVRPNAQRRPGHAPRGPLDQRSQRNAAARRGSETP